MRYQLRHLTTYTYDDVVTDSLGVAHLVPRTLPWQQVEDYAVTVTPDPGDQQLDTDFHGNQVSYFQVLTPHRELVVEGGGEVVVEAPDLPEELLTRSWRSVRPLEPTDAEPDPGAWRAAEMVLASPSVPWEAAAIEYAAPSFADPTTGIGAVVTDLMHRIHADFAYDPTATTVTSTVPEILESRAGVCQDFAHLLLACLRGHGVAARYVSGYLSTMPPPGRERVVGADASHAWVEVWIGGEHWLPVDPTNDQWVRDRHVTVAWGRDYSDVTPLKGVIFTEAKRSTMRVSVDVAPVV